MLNQSIKVAVPVPDVVEQVGEALLSDLVRVRGVLLRRWLILRDAGLQVVQLNGRDWIG